MSHLSKEAIKKNSVQTNYTVCEGFREALNAATNEIRQSKRN